jgi:hypothetical protein
MEKLERFGGDTAIHGPCIHNVQPSDPKATYATDQVYGAAGGAVSHSALHPFGCQNYNRRAAFLGNQRTETFSAFDFPVLRS